MNWQWVDEATKRKIQVESRDDGEFWMSFRDFCRHFQEVTICLLGPDFDGDGVQDTVSKLCCICLDAVSKLCCICLDAVNKWSISGAYVSAWTQSVSGVCMSPWAQSVSGACVSPWTQ